ncbi:MAG TPA: FAD-dependent oxidoreductase [Candidatus Angelobacter sp.]|nr:FAD-dependent oxidoreductase [Candidatus Angelobacter sp.]
MAEPTTARLAAACELGKNARLLQFTSDAPLNFSGGQYIIVHTGIEIEGGKTAKRAYSILSGDRNQHGFELGVRRIGAGPGSNFMHRLPVGTAISFTGAWGKFGVGNRLEPNIPAAPALVVATDTGITAAIGLLNSEGFRQCAPQADVYWILESGDYFLPESFVRERIHGCYRNFDIRFAPPVASAARRDWLADLLDEIGSHSLENRPGAAFLAGDGTLVFAMRERLTQLGVADIRIETFFNHQEKKTETKAIAF